MLPGEALPGVEVPRLRLGLGSEGRAGQRPLGRASREPPASPLDPHGSARAAPIQLDPGVRSQPSSGRSGSSAAELRKPLAAATTFDDYWSRPSSVKSAVLKTGASHLAMLDVSPSFPSRPSSGRSSPKSALAAAPSSASWPSQDVRFDRDAGSAGRSASGDARAAAASAAAVGELGRARLSSRRRETASLGEPPPTADLPSRQDVLGGFSASSSPWQGHVEAYSEAKVQARAAASTSVCIPGYFDPDEAGGSPLDGDAAALAGFAEARARARAEAKARRRAAEQLDAQAAAREDEAAAAQALLHFDAERLQRSRIEAEALLEKKLRHIQELERDISDRSRAVDRLRDDVAAADSEVQAARARAEQLHRRYQAMLAVEGSPLERLEELAGHEQHEAASWSRAVNDLQRAAETRPKSEQQRLYWAERAAALELELKEQRRLLEPVLRDADAAQRRRDEAAEEGQNLQSQLLELEEAFAGAGVDIGKLLQDGGGVIGELDIILALCLAILPESAAPSVLASAASGPPKRATPARRPPLVPQHAPAPHLRVAARSCR